MLCNRPRAETDLPAVPQEIQVSEDLGDRWMYRYVQQQCESNKVMVAEMLLRFFFKLSTIYSSYTCSYLILHVTYLI